MSYSLPPPPRTHLLLGAGYSYGVGCGIGPFFGIGVALNPIISFGAGAGIGAFCGVGFGAGIVGTCGTGTVTGLSTSVFYQPRLEFLEKANIGNTGRTSVQLVKRVFERFVGESRSVVSGLTRFLRFAGGGIPRKR